MRKCKSNREIRRMHSKIDAKWWSASQAFLFAALRTLRCALFSYRTFSVSMALVTSIVVFPFVPHAFLRIATPSNLGHAKKLAPLAAVRYTARRYAVEYTSPVAARCIGQLYAVITSKSLLTRAFMNNGMNNPQSILYQITFSVREWWFETISNNRVCLASLSLFTDERSCLIRQSS